MRHLILILALCAFAFSACKHDPPTDTTTADTVHQSDDAAPLPVALTTDATVTRAAPFVAATWHNVQPFDVHTSQPTVAQRVPVPDSPRAILPHLRYRGSDHARNASGRFTNADC